MTTISLKLPPVLLKQVEAEARDRGLTKSALIRHTLQASLRRKRGGYGVTCLDLMQGMVGTFAGPRDLSTNPAHLEAALTAEHERTRKRPR